MTTQATALQVTEDEATGARFITYTTKAGVGLELHFDGDEPWFTQKDIATMFGVDTDTVSAHIAKFAADGEIDEATTGKFPVVRIEGNRRVERHIQHYNLDVAFYVGYRVNSAEGKQFRKWATQTLVQLATKGFVVDKRKLSGNADRLRELREIIADLRSDEANMYAELRLICSMCKDYDPALTASRNFFALFQNRMLYAITAKDAAALIIDRAKATEKDMGLKAWKGDYVLQTDVGTAKNYLGPLELKDLNRLVGMVLEFFADQTERGFLVSMADAESKLLEILTVNKRKLMPGIGSVTTKRAKAHAKGQYVKFKAVRRMAEVKALEEAAKLIIALPKPSRKKRGAA